MAMSLGRGWLRAAQVGRAPVVAMSRRLASSKVDPLDLDEDEPTVEEAAPEPVPEATEEAAEQPPKQRYVYSFGCMLNGRTGVNASNADMLLPLSAQQPKEIEFLSNFKIKKISSLYKHYLALTEDGRVFAWGSNRYGQLGCGDDSMLQMDRHAPVLVRTEDGRPLENIVDIGGGKYHSAAVDSDGRVWTWGYGGRRGRFMKAGHLLGYAAGKGVFQKYQPWAVPLAEFGPVDGMEVESAENQFEEGKSLNPKAVKVACGAIHTVVLDSFGRAWTWGYGEWGRLGQDDNEDRPKPTPVVFFLDEKTGLPRTTLSSVEACESITSFITPDGAVYVCGRNYTRQLGFGQDDQGLMAARFEAVNIPHNIGSLSGVTHVSFGSHSALATTKVGAAYYWGSQETKGPQSLLGFGQRSKQKICKVAAGYGVMVDHRAFITTDGLLYLTGANTHGQALADTRPREEGASALSVIIKWLKSWRPTRLSTIDVRVQSPVFFQDKKVVDVCCGHASTVVIAEKLEGDELKQREELLEATVKEYEEADAKRRGKKKA